MDYAIDNNFPNLGFVVIDSPLISKADPKNKDIDAGAATNRLYEWLSASKNLGQIIILEN